MPIDAKEALTRKLGPLPAWGWAVALGGAVIVARLFRKPSSSTVSGNAPTSVGGGEVIGSGGDATPTDVFSGANSLVEQLQEQVTGQQSTIAGLSDTIKSVTDFQALQTKLTALLKQRADALYSLSAWKTTLNTYQDKLRACKTTACKTTQKKNIANANAKIATYSKLATDLNAAIAAIQQQMNGSNT